MLHCLALCSLNLTHILEKALHLFIEQIIENFTEQSFKVTKIQLKLRIFTMRLTLIESKQSSFI